MKQTFCLFTFSLYVKFQTKFGIPVYEREKTEERSVAMPCEIHLTAQVFSYIVKTTRMVCDCFKKGEDEGNLGQDKMAIKLSCLCKWISISGTKEYRCLIGHGKTL